MNPTAPDRRRRPRAFTLTEIMIALALTAMLLVGISRIFAITSTTITTGQALSKAMRSHKAVQTVLSSDFLGVGDIGRPQAQSGMVPFVNSASPDYAAPFFSISCSRVATYVNRAAFDADTVQPADTATMTNAIFGQRSLAIRGIDLNKDGDEADVGEVIPLFQYGERNFRTDTLNMFVRGNFTSQTGTDGFVDPVTSGEAWVWYGHMRVYNSVAASIYNTNGYGPPGDWLTPTSTLFPTPAPNTNNRFADQFRLGRFAGLLVEPTDVKSSYANTANLARPDRNTVVARGDYSKPVAFVRRNWWVPSDKTTLVTDPMTGQQVEQTSGTLLPITFSLTSGNVVKFVATSGTVGMNQNVMADGKLAGTPGASTIPGRAPMALTDVFGVGLRQLRDCAAYVAQRNAAWRSQQPVDWTDRPWVNPFPATITPTGLAQRQQILTDSASQFIVEFAGDFITQAPDGTPAVTNPTLPDGVLDFAFVGGVQQTRFYGMPRDVDGDGVIAGTGPGRWTSPDVIPVRDVLGAPAAFEQSVPTPTAVGDYLTVVDEPGGADDDGNATNYVCVWGPTDYAGVPVTTAGVTVTRRAIPQLVRILVDVRDANGKLAEAVTQEHIFPVRVTASIER